MGTFDVLLEVLFFDVSFATAIIAADKRPLVGM